MNKILLICIAFLISYSYAFTVFTEDNVRVVTYGVVEPAWSEEVEGREQVGALWSTTVFYIDVFDESFSEPTIEILGDNKDDVLSPFLDGDASLGYTFYTSGLDYDVESWQLRVLYFCSGEGEVDLKITVNYGTFSEESFEEGQEQFSKSVSWVWSKKCAKGVDGYRPGFTVVTEYNGEPVKDGKADPQWHHTSTPEETSTTFFLWMTDGCTEGSCGTQTFSEPVVKSSEPWLYPFARGEASIENVLDQEFQDLQIVYSCSSNGVAEVTVSIEIAPFHPVEFTWKKDCGGGARKGFDIGWEVVSDVVSNGEVVEGWRVDDDDTKLQTIPVDQRTTTFWIRMGVQQKQQFSRPIVSHKPGKICRPTVVGQFANGGIASDISTKLVVNYNCQQKGTPTLTMTLALPQYKAIEFSWKKECVKLPPLTEEGFTANQLLLFFSLALAGVIGLSAFVYFQFIRSPKQQPFIST